MKCFFKNFIMLTTFLLSVQGFADSLFHGKQFSYFGKLPTSYISSTHLNLEVTFYASESGNDLVSRAPRFFKNVSVADGTFNLIMQMDDVEFGAVFKNPPRPAYIQIKDLDRGVSFRRMAFLPVITEIQGDQVSSEATVSIPQISGSGARADSIPPSSALLTAAHAACLATNTAGAKYIVEVPDQVTCQSACIHTEARSQCVRGWTKFSDGRYFEFGDECEKANSGFQTPVLSRICCCVTNATPMPLDVPPAHH